MGTNEIILNLYKYLNYLFSVSTVTNYYYCHDAHRNAMYLGMHTAERMPSGQVKTDRPVKGNVRHDIKNSPPLNNPVKGVHRSPAVAASRRVRGLTSVIGVLAPRALIYPLPPLTVNTVSHADLISLFVLIFTSLSTQKLERICWYLMFSKFNSRK